MISISVVENQRRQIIECFQTSAFIKEEFEDTKCMGNQNPYNMNSNKITNALEFCHNIILI